MTVGTRRGRSGLDHHTASWRALGTYVSVTVTDATALDEAVELLDAELSAADRSLSRFRDDSELARVNRNAGRPVPVSGYFLAALDTALRVADMTGGLVDPLLGNALIAAGYDGDFAGLPADGPAVGPLRPRPQLWRRIVVDRSVGTVRIPAGSQLDLGSSGKPHAAERAAATVAAATGVPVMVGLGGDVAVAGPAPDQGWPVRVSERADDRDGVTLVIRDGGLATSSTLLRRWRRGGVWQHHVIDPRTGRPAGERWRTVAVAAASCVEANAASTASIVLGADALGWLERVGLPARLVDELGAVTVVGGWPPDGAHS